MYLVEKIGFLYVFVCVCKCEREILFVCVYVCVFVLVFVWVCLCECMINQLAFWRNVYVHLNYSTLKIGLNAAIANQTI